MIKITENNKVCCCGCRACDQICPVHCITMKYDDEGFLYPEVDVTKCTNCGRCDSVCPMLQEKYHNEYDIFNIPKAYGGWINDLEIREQSSSGGAFSLFADWILTQNGIVYGAMQDDTFFVRHEGVKDKNSLVKLRKSKYVQSDIGNVYKEIKQYLEEKIYILFVGAPCQVAGLQSFLGKSYTTLYSVDFICHGVPSPKIYHEYLKWLEQKYHDTIIEFSFRNKDKGWRSLGQLGTLIKFRSGKTKRKYPCFKDSFMNGFSDDIYLRPICYECRFKSLPKYYSDITIADFWGVKNVDKELYDGKGTSLVLVHNSHGDELFSFVNKNMFFKECDFKRAILKNRSLLESADVNPDRQNFFEDYKKNGMDYVIKKYMNSYKWIFHKCLKILCQLLEKSG